MNDTIWQQIAATSWWVIIVFGLIAYQTYLTTKPKIIPAAQLAASVLLFCSASALSIYFFAQFNPITMKWWVMMMLGGLASGWLYYWRLNIICFPDEKKIMIPGSWLNLLILLGTTVIIYLTNLHMPTDPDALMTGKYSASIITFYGFATGFMIGRFFYGMFLLKKAALAH